MISQSVVHDALEVFSTSGWQALKGDDETLLGELEPHVLEGIHTLQEAMIESGVPKVSVSYWNTGALFIVLMLVKQSMRDKNQGFDHIISQLRDEVAAKKRFTLWVQRIILMTLLVFMSMVCFFLIT